MTFRDGEDAEKDCPKCGKPLYYFMSFTDQWSYTSGHYTTDFPMLVCESCDYDEEYEDER